MLSRVITLLGIAASISIVAIMTLASPSSAGPAGILALFVCIYIVVMSAITFSLYYLSRLARGLVRGDSIRRRATLTLQKSYYFASVLALGPVLFIGMQSVSGIGLYESGLVLLLVGLGCVYVARKSP